MAKKQYHVTTTPKAPSRGKAAESSGTGTSLNVTVEGSLHGDGHTHSNKVLLDSLSSDQERYLLITQKDGNNSESTTEKAKAGHADTASTADTAANADKLDNLDSSQFLRSDVEDTAEEKMTFKKGVNIGNFIADILHGTGGSIDEEGNAELQSLVIRQFLEVPEMRFNRLTVIGDEQWGTTGGVIEAILPDGNPDDNRYRIKIKLEAGETNLFKEGDIIKGIYHGTYVNQQGISVTGFYSMFAAILSKETDPNFDVGIMDLNLLGNLYKPQSQMIIARVGNLLYKEVNGQTVAVYPERQRSWRISVSKGNFQFYDKVDSWQITSANIMLHMGECKGANLPGVPATAEGFVFWGANMYSQLGITQIDVEGHEVIPIKWKGLWSAGTYSRNNEVSHRGCIYQCIVESTSQEPRYDSSDWIMISGNPDFIMSISSSAGDVLLESDMNTTLSASVQIYNQNINDDIPSAQWSWKRESADSASDALWNAAHVGYGREVEITPSSLPGIGVRQIKFTCTAYIDEVASVAASVII